MVRAFSVFVMTTLVAIARLGGDCFGPGARRSL